MSRHSHWAKIKRGKGNADAARGQAFSKLARVITVAAREGGGDPAFNFKLRLVTDRAKAAAMSKDAIDRAIARGTGAGSGASIETVVYEGIAAGGAAVLVECLTDNRNRTLGEVKTVFRDHGATFGNEGSVRWQFQQRGVVRAAASSSQLQASSREGIELKLIEAGAEDIREGDGELVVFTKVEDLQRVREAASAAGHIVSDAGLEWVAKQPIDVPADARERFEAFLAALDELDDVQEIYTNASGY